MSRREIIVIEDDLDGGEAADTIQWGLDGILYEIDLNDANVKAFRNAVTRFQEASRRVGRFFPSKTGGYVPVQRATQATGATSRARVDKEQNKAVRAWAKRAGIEVSERGRIPQDIMRQFEAEAGRR